MHEFVSFHVRYFSFPLYPPWFHCNNNIRLRIQIMMLFW
jgi:hypothetical protein